MRIALMPLDERPVNTTLPAAVAAIASAELELPPSRLLPRFRSPGDVEGLNEWARSVGPDVQAMVVSIDMLAYGGLIPSRTSSDDATAVLQRLGVLGELRAASPATALLGVSLIMRASDSYSPEEEPPYWADLGRDIHAFGGRLHRVLAGQQVDDLLGSVTGAEHELADFETRRIRNHVVNLHCLSEASRGLFDLLLLTSDDTAEYSAGSAEVEWLEHWRRALPSADDVTLMHPGADEVGSILVANALSRTASRKPRVRIVADRAAGLDVIPAYENRPIGLAARSQVAAAGGVVVDEGEADLWLIIHTPHPDRHDWYGPPHASDREGAGETARLVHEAKHAGALAVVADTRQTNGGDPALLAALLEHDALSSVDAYGGWNTAGNAMGSAIAAGVAAAVGLVKGTLDPVALRRLVVHRLLEDVGYQSTVRPAMLRARPELLDRDAFGVDEARITTEVTTRLRELLLEWGLGAWDLSSVRFPWNRSFEVDFELTEV